MKDFDATQADEIPSSKKFFPFFWRRDTRAEEKAKNENENERLKLYVAAENWMRKNAWRVKPAARTHTHIITIFFYVNVKFEFSAKFNTTHGCHVQCALRLKSKQQQREKNPSINCLLMYFSFVFKCLRVYVCDESAVHTAHKPIGF